MSLVPNSNQQTSTHVTEPSLPTRKWEGKVNKLFAVLLVESTVSLKSSVSLAADVLV
jgi:hypothetical protein